MRRLALGVGLCVCILVAGCTNSRNESVREIFGEVPVQLGPVMSLEKAAKELADERDWPAVLALSQPGDQVQYFCACSTNGILMGTEGYALKTFGEINY